MSNNDDDSPWGNSSGGGKKPDNNNPDFDKILKKGKEKLNKLFNQGSNYGGGGKFTPPTNINIMGFVPFLVLVFVLLWLSTGFYTITEGEEAVVQRFGKFTRVANTGLNYHFPSPFENVIKQRVDMIEREEIGFRSIAGNGSSNNKQNLKNVPEESLMLTGDENIVDINFVVQWRINNIEHFVFSLNRQKETIKSTAESAMREIIGNTPISSALAEGKSGIESKTRALLQSVLDSYKSGVEIVSVQMLRADPPSDVIDSFRDVQTARADQEREINQAQSYMNDIIPRARGDAAKLEQEAEAYKQQVVARSEGDSKRFISVYNEYKLAKDITKKRMYLETVESVLNGMDKYIIDSKANGLVPYLPLSNKTQEKQ